MMQTPEPSELSVPEQVTRVPPHSNEAERSILGCMLLNNQECVDDAMARLVPDDFYQPIHREIFTAMGELVNEGSPVDLVSVSELLEKTGRSPQGTFEYLTSLAEDILSPANVPHHIGIVADKSALRKVIGICTQISADCYAGKEEAESILGRAGDAIYELSSDRTQGDVIHLREAIQRSYAQLSEIVKNKGGTMGVRTGFPTMDGMLSGFQKDQLIIIAARPAMGKTSFALNIVQNASMSQQNTVCLFFSLEMSADQLATRMLCAEAHVDMQLTRSGRMGPEEFEKLADASGRLSKAPIYIDDSAVNSVTEMLAKARRLKRQKGLDMIVVDYLQLMTGSGKTENRNQEIAQITRSLKIMSKELQVPVVVLSQLSRQGEKDGSKFPKLSELRESGAIEQDADVVIFLQREDYYVEQRTDENIGKARIIIAKQRNGPTGAIDVRWNGEYTRYMEAEKFYADELG